MMKALVVDDPWIGLILDGGKTWEMRTRAVRLRGRVGLIRKRSGLVVGVVDLVGSGPRLDPDAYAEAEAFHRIPPARQAAAIAGGWVQPWILEGVRPLPRPVPYSHPRGAVTWVNLSPEVEAAILTQL